MYLCIYIYLHIIYICFSWTWNLYFCFFKITHLGHSSFEVQSYSESRQAQIRLNAGSPPVSAGHCSRVLLGKAQPKLVPQEDKTTHFTVRVEGWFQFTRSTGIGVFFHVLFDICQCSLVEYLFEVALLEGSSKQHMSLRLFGVAGVVCIR